MLAGPIADISDASPDARPAWRLGWLTPRRCRLILAILLAINFLAGLRYLTNNCPIDLTGDEAQYWDWSRQLGLSYYSKGPLVAYIIRGSCAIFGDAPQAVRYPALALGVLTALVTYITVARLFRSERLALGTVLLNAIVPMFIAGGTLMTIDPPYYLCWGMATCCAAAAIFDGRRAAWIGVGVALGVGFLAKYAIFLWYLPIVAFLVVDPRRRRMLREPWPWIAVIISLICTTPVVLWNARHDWATFRHVSHQTGASGAPVLTAVGRLMSMLEYVGTQVGVIGPLLAIFLIAGIVYVIRRKSSGSDPNRERLSYLAWIGLTFLAILLVDSLFTKIQPNWPAAAYFTLLILTAYFIGTRLRSPQLWKPWRGFFWASVVLAVVITPILRDSAIAFPIVRWFGSATGRKIDPAKIDLQRKLRGWAELGSAVSTHLSHMRPGSFVLCHDYQQTAEMAMYVAGQPTTYCAGPYYEDRASRASQYDMWPEHRLTADNPAVFGRDAVFVGEANVLRRGVAAAFNSVDGPFEIRIFVRGVAVRSFWIYRCYGFKGMTRHVREGVD